MVRKEVRPEASKQKNQSAGLVKGPVQKRKPRERKRPMTGEEFARFLDEIDAREGLFEA